MYKSTMNLQKQCLQIHRVSVHVNLKKVCIIFTSNFLFSISICFSMLHLQLHWFSTPKLF